MDHYVSIFDVMSKHCGHINAELKKSSYTALESFLKQVFYLWVIHCINVFILDFDLLRFILCGNWKGMMTFCQFFCLIVKVATLVAENIELHKSKLKFFMQKFCAIIRTMDSTNKELSIAIRGYGLFAAVCVCLMF